MDQLIGQSLGHYHIDTPLGKGGMGAVYRATDVTLRRPVAIKVMHSHLAQNSEFTMRFLAEARAAAQLKHSNIVQIYDFGKSQELLYIVMEFLPGDNLRRKLDALNASGRWIVLSEVAALMRQVCRAIDYAHSQGVLHRDLKPENIMLTPDALEDLPYHPVLTDLGLARVLSEEHLTQSGILIGTPAYMSPEQALGEETDAQSDIYSLGIMLYELAVGRLPFPLKTLSEAIRFHHKASAPPLDFPRSDLPESLKQVVEHAIEKDPAARYASAGQMADALAAIPIANVTRAGAPAPDTTEALVTVSLSTVHAPGAVDSRGASVWDEFPVMDPAIQQDGISILLPNHDARTVLMKSKELMKSEGLKIGRGRENDVDLDDDQVSRRHAQVTFDGTHYLVTDLDSANGTYLADIKLLPRKSEVWTPDKLLRIGKHYLRLDRHPAATGKQPPGSTARNGTRTVPGGPADSTQGRVGVFLEKSTFEVAPGQTVQVPLTIINQGEVVDHFGVSVEGIPPQWLPGELPFVQLMPGFNEPVQFTIQPPRASTSRAGAYPIKLRVTSRVAPDQVTERDITLAVEPYYELNAQLTPEKVRAGKPAQVTVQNSGNTTETYLIEWQDQGNELSFTPPRAQVMVEEGKAAAIPFGAVPYGRRWIGGEKIHPFSVQIVSPYAGSYKLPGHLVSSGLIPTWLPPLLLLALLLLCGALYALLVKAPVVEVFERNSPTSVSWRVTNCESVELRDGTKTQASSLPCNHEYSFDDKPFPANLNLVARNAFAPLVGVAIESPVAFVPPTPLPTAVPPAPTVVFSVDPQTIVAGQPVTISWQVSNARSIQLKSGDAINTVANSGSMPDSPDQSRTYTLIVQQLAAGQDPIQRSIQVRVATPVPTPNAAATTAAKAALTLAAQLAKQASAVTAAPPAKAPVVPIVVLPPPVPATAVPPTTAPTRPPTAIPTPFGGGGGHIAFTSDRDGNREIYVMNVDGTGQTRLTNSPATDAVSVWSLDGKRIAFVSTRDGNAEIYTMSVDGSGQTRLTNNPAQDDTPAWSPDGKRIAFYSNRDGQYEIYVMNADGSGQTRLTNNPAGDYWPVWSPDGKRIAFASDRDGNLEIYVMNADGSGQTRLTNNPASDQVPAWSPDGKRIAFTSDRDGNLEIYVMNADGSGQTRLTNNPANDANPAWSPDGRWIAFVSTRDGQYEIYVMNADGSGQTRLTNNSANDYWPTWQP